MSEWKDVITGPRWAKVPKWLRQKCFERNLTLDMHIDKGWIRESVFFSVTGDDELITQTKNEFYDTARRYNATPTDVHL